MGCGVICGYFITCLCNKCDFIKRFSFWAAMRPFLYLTRLIKSTLSSMVISPRICNSKNIYITIRLRAGLCEMPEDYHYSSAGFYYDGSNNLECWHILQETKCGFVNPLVKDQTGPFLSLQCIRWKVEHLCWRIIFYLR